MVYKDESILCYTERVCDCNDIVCYCINRFLIVFVLYDLYCERARMYIYII